MSARRVAIVTTSYPARPGDPSGHFVEAEARQLALGDATVTVLAPRPVGAEWEAPQGSKLHVVWLPGGAAFGWPGALERIRENPLRAFPALRFCVSACRALHQLGPFDAIVAHWIVPSAWPVAIGAGQNLEIVVHGSDVAVLERLPRRLATAIVRSLLDGGARFRFVSDELRRRVGGFDPRALGPDMRTKASPVRIDGVPDRCTARARFAIRDDERLAVIVGRLVSGKRTDVAIAWASARADRVIVIGDGPERRSLETSRVTFVGQLPRPETLAWIAAADCLVSASRSEGAPTVVREARLLGVPVVSAPAGDVAVWAATDPGITVIDA